jgi:hypothetical protein
MARFAPLPSGDMAEPVEPRVDPDHVMDEGLDGTTGD